MKSQQLSLLTESNTIFSAAALIPAIKAAMRAMAERSGKSREEIADAINAICLSLGIRLTSGRAKGIHKDTLDKWLNPEESEHVPGILALHVFCLALGGWHPLERWLALLGCGAEIMTEEDRHLRDLGRELLRKEEAAQRFNQTKQKLKELKR